MKQPLFHPARIATTLLVVAGLAAGAAPAAEVRDCDRSESRVQKSPDGRYLASVQEEVCSFGDQAGAAITVVLAPADSPDQGRRVAATAVPRSRDLWARTRWVNGRTLEVWVPNLANVLEIEPAWRDVSISLKYCADNPEHRRQVAEYAETFERYKKEASAWSERRKRDPASAGPAPRRPEQPRLPQGACDPADFPG